MWYWTEIQRTLNWPTPGNSTDIHTLLGLVCYIVNFLPTLANYTHVLTPLLTKETKSNFVWNEMHQITFESIKSLVVSINCLTVINHCDPNNKIFVACDASDQQNGACLGFWKTWETAQPVAYSLMQLGNVEKNYPIHEKELLAIVHVLKRWQTDLLGAEFNIYTNHQTLKNFNTQHDLSWHQLH